MLLSPWTTSKPLSRGCSQQNLLSQTFLRHSGRMAEPTQLGFLDPEMCLDIQGFTNFIATHFAAKYHIVNSLQESHTSRLHLR